LQHDAIKQEQDQEQEQGQEQEQRRKSIIFFCPEITIMGYVAKRSKQEHKYSLYSADRL
jgi:hypothetical protein